MYQRDFALINKSDNNILSVVLMADSFFYAIFDSSNSLICHKSYTGLQFSDAGCLSEMLADANLRAGFAKISVVAIAGDAHHLPGEDHGLVEKFPGLEWKLRKMEKMVDNQVYTYFGISPHQEHLLHSLFGADGYVLTHFSNLLASYYVLNVGNTIHAHIEEKTITLFKQSDGAFLYYNTFEIKENNDILYFILAVFQSTGLDPLLDTLTLSGWLEKDSALFTLIYGYIANVFIIHDNAFLMAPGCSSELKPHFYFIHFANALCAS